MKGARFKRLGDEEIKIPLIQPLFNDLIECEQMLDKVDTQFARRTYVRASFAYLEGHIYWWKGQVSNWLLRKGANEGLIDISKIVLLSDNFARANKHGKLQPEANRTPFLNMCAFVLRSGAECWNLDPSSFFADNGWNEMQAALAVRHRITHPKRPEDLEISDLEIDAIREAHRWFINCTIDVVNAMSATVDRNEEGLTGECAEDKQS